MNAPAKPTIAVFDFDGTLTMRDSFFDFLFFTFGYRAMTIRAVPLIGTLTRYGIGFLTAHEAKEKILASFVGGMSQEAFEIFCEVYARERLPRIVRPQAVAKAAWHKAQGDRLVIASASPGNWIAPWARANGFDEVIATRLEAKEGKMTGRLSGANCAGEEKKRRFLEVHPDRNAYALFVYSDSMKDRPLLALADKAWYRKF